MPSIMTYMPPSWYDYFRRDVNDYIMDNES